MKKKQKLVDYSRLEICPCLCHTTYDNWGNCKDCKGHFILTFGVKYIKEFRKIKK